MAARGRDLERFPTPPGARRSRLLLATTVAVAVASLSALAPSAAPAAEVDPFYSSRFHEGRAAYDRGEYQEAVFSLRLACFGMLEVPRELAECLVWLAMAQAGADDREGFAATFRRLAEAEELVGLYSDSELPAELRAAFESRALEWIPPATLAATPAFTELAIRREEQRLATLAPRARRSELERLIEDRPGEARWPYLLARLEQDERRPGPALEASERALFLDSGDRGAACVQAWAQAALGRCEEAVDVLRGCSEREQLYATALLECRGAAEIHAAAPSPPGTYDHPLSALTQEQLDQARQLAASARTAAELEHAYRQVSEVLAAHPDSRGARFLAGEIAYRASRWRQAVEHFRNGGGPGEDEPQLVFYFAVALYESGDREAAAEALRCCSDRLRSTPFVEQYVRRILGGS